MGFIRCKVGDVQVGQALPWPVYTEAGVLLLDKGHEVENAHQLEMLIERGMHPDGKPQKLITPLDKQIDNPFPHAYELRESLNNILRQLSYPTEDGPKRLFYTAELIYRLCQQHPDAMLSMVHHYNETPYSITHSIHVAILSCILGQEMGYEEQRLLMTMAGALTANIAMLDLQDKLEKQTTALDDEQRQAIRNHPLETVKMLHRNIIYDQIWLTAVEQHHENIDGSGYPAGLSGKAIAEEAQIVAIADRYSAQVCRRATHEYKTAQEVLKTLYLEKGKTLDEDLTLRFIKMLGVYPPGSMVHLVNGETAIVTQRPRAKGDRWPMVASFLGRDGKHYLNPLKRDTNLEDYKISEAVADQEIHFSNSVLWGYE